MPTLNNPYIRDMLTIDSRMREVDKAFAGDGPVFLLGRIVQHDVGVDLRVGSRPLIIVADEYNGTGGIINARGDDGAGVGGHGGSGRTVTVLCRRSVNARILAAGETARTGSPAALAARRSQESRSSPLSIKQSTSARSTTLAPTRPRIVATIGAMS